VLQSTYVHCSIDSLSDDELISLKPHKPYVVVSGGTNRML